MTKITNSNYDYPVKDDYPPKKAGGKDSVKDTSKDVVKDKDNHKCPEKEAKCWGGEKVEGKTNFEKKELKNEFKMPEKSENSKNKEKMKDLKDTLKEAMKENKKTDKNEKVENKQHNEKANEIQNKIKDGTKEVEKNQSKDNVKETESTSSKESESTVSKNNPAERFVNSYLTAKTPEATNMFKDALRTQTWDSNMSLKDVKKYLQSQLDQGNHPMEGRLREFLNAVQQYENGSK